jgi:arsenite methyltransferase
MDQNADALRQTVREHYAAQATAGSCCGPDACCDSSSSKLYSVEMLTELPTDVASFSLGCGDPITLAELQPGQSVIDLGSGGGLDCFLAARKVGEAGRVIGIDMTPEMLDRARAAAQRLQVTNVEFRQGYLEELPVTSDSIDVAISNCVINLSPDKSKVLSEVFRILRPGGKLAVSDVVTDGPLPAEVKNSLSAWAGCIAGALDVRDYEDKLSKAGFVDISVSPTYFDEATIDEAIQDMGKAVSLKTISREQIRKSVFSARITARKP